MRMKPPLLNPDNYLIKNALVMGAGSQLASKTL
jgi:hypothetical protein